MLFCGRGAVTERTKKPSHLRGFNVQRSLLRRGAPVGIRTQGLPLRRRTLYPAELQVPAICFCLFPIDRKHLINRIYCIILPPFMQGAAGEKYRKSPSRPCAGRNLPTPGIETNTSQALPFLPKAMQPFPAHASFSGGTLSKGGGAAFLCAP